MSSSHSCLGDWYSITHAVRDGTEGEGGGKGFTSTGGGDAMLSGSKSESDDSPSSIPSATHAALDVNKVRAEPCRLMDCFDVA